MITGGSRGIGLGIARALAEAKCDIVINGRRDGKEVGAVINNLEGLGAEVLYCQADVSSASSRSQMLAAIKDRFGRLDVLVNNAGVAPLERKDLLEGTEESFDRVMKINLQGPYFLAQEVANWMIQQKQEREDFSGCLINIGSISATVVSVSRGEYCVSKAGMAMMTQLFAVRLGEYDIPVYEIRPGIIATDMTAGVKQKYDQLIEKGMMVQARWGQPEDVGRVAAALVLGMFPYSTGQHIMIDGGMTIPRL